MNEIIEIVKSSIVHQKLQHVASAGTISAGAVEKITSTEAVTNFDLMVSYFGDAAVIVAPIFTIFLIYKEYRKHRREEDKNNREEEAHQVALQISKLQLSKEGRREADK